jgi:acetoin utilization deacetylase AcuC-like enzyme
MSLVFTDPIFREHRTAEWHPERPRRLDAALEGVERAGVADRIRTPGTEHPATAEMIELVHAPELVRDLETACASGQTLFYVPDNSICSRTAEVARAAVSTVLHAAEEVMGGSRAFVIARPPGHHAERDRAMGFCFYNTIACGAEWLLRQPAIGRVFILDWDVHHGNGTQQIFESRPEVFYLSLHSYPFFPGTGASSERGVGPGEGTVLNIPLRAGSGDSIYLNHFERIVLPEIERFDPDVILVSAGFDAHRADPIGNMAVTSESFGEMTRLVVEAAERHSAGRLLTLLEGGYDPEALASSVEQHVANL